MQSNKIDAPKDSYEIQSMNRIGYQTCAVIICAIESAKKFVRLWDPSTLGFASLSEFNARRVLFQQSRKGEEALYQQIKGLGWA